MLPTINILGRDFPTYALCACAGILVVLFSTMHAARRFKVDDNNILILGLFSALGVFLGAHLLYGITNFNLIIEFFQNLDTVFIKYSSEK